MRKESLWPHLDKYVDKTIRFIKKQKRVPDIVHGHYPDAGYVAAMLAEIFGVPLVYEQRFYLIVLPTDECAVDIRDQKLFQPGQASSDGFFRNACVHLSAIETRLGIFDRLQVRGCVALPGIVFPVRPDLTASHRLSSESTG